MSFRILCVCTGNICRSPMADLLMRAGVVPLKLDDMPDPYQRQVKHAKTVAQEITEAVQVALDMLNFSPRAMQAARPLPNRS